MSMNIEYQVIDWEKITMTEHPGITGQAYCKTIIFNALMM